MLAYHITLNQVPANQKNYCYTKKQEELAPRKRITKHT